MLNIEISFEPRVKKLTPKILENLMFYLSTMKSGNAGLYGKLLMIVEENKYILSGKITDHFMIMGILNLHRLNRPGVWDQIEHATVHKLMKH
jgi:hypothetical protein